MAADRSIFMAVSTIHIRMVMDTEIRDGSLLVDTTPILPYIFGAMFKRDIVPTKSNSYFLFGPRQTGKSTLVKSLITPKDLYIDLLPQRNFLNYAKNPGRLREEILAHQYRHENPVCVIDEIQKIPSILDEVHELIESKGIRFILTCKPACNNDPPLARIGIQN